MANRYYNVCYAESIVFMFHQLLRFIITKQTFLHWRQVAPRRQSAPFANTQCLEGQLKSKPRSKGKHFFDEPFEFYINQNVFFQFFISTKHFGHSQDVLGLKHVPQKILSTSCWHEVLKKGVTGCLLVDNSKIKVRAQKGLECFVDMKN